MTEESIFGTG